jgi:uncharacterized protein YceK
MKTVAVALVVFGLIAGCSQTQSPAPSASPDRPESYASQKECEKAGRTWNGTAGVCM